MASPAADKLIEELKSDAEKGELLLWASARGLTADVKELVQTGADPGAKDKYGRQAVHYAASNGHLDILEYFFTKGVLLDAEDEVGRGALHYACAGGHAECARFLLGKECWRDAPDAADDTPLHLAARNGRLDTLRALLEAGAKLTIANKRSLTAFAEAVLAGCIPAAQFLGAAMPGGMAGALAQTCRGVPLLHLAAGLGQAAAVEWLVRKQGCDLAAAATDQRYTPLHAAALSGDADTVQALLTLGADPLSETQAGKLPLELVPRAAATQAPSRLNPRALPPPPEDPNAAPQRPDPALVRSARRAFKALARAAAAQGGVDPEDLARRGAAVRDKAQGGAAGLGPRSGQQEESGAEEAQDQEGEGEEQQDLETAEESPAAVFLRQFLAMTSEQQVAKVELYARMDERQVQELPYLDTEAQAAITALRHAMGMVEVFGAVAALRADEDFQADIRDPRVRDALADAKRTNNLERYEDQAAVMSVANKFKRLHAVTRKAGGLQVVIDDLRADLPGNDAVSTAEKMSEMRQAQAECARRAAQAVLKSASTALPEHIRSRIAQQVQEAATVTTTVGKRGGGDGRGRSEITAAGPEALEGQGGAGPDLRTQEDEEALKARLSHKARIDKLRAAATSAWTKREEAEEAVGFVDRFAKTFEDEAAKAEGKGRWWLANYVGEELAQSLVHTLRALVMTLAAFVIMWCLGLMPHQQTRALQSRLEAARRAQEAAEALAATPGGAHLEGLEAAGVAEAVAAAAAGVAGGALGAEGTCGA